MVGRLPHPVVPAYAELTVHATWRVSPKLDLMLVGDNLLHDRHLEAGAPPVSEEFPRSIFGQITWRR
jgi:iron complex outermembrane receptor protein